MSEIRLLDNQTIDKIAAGEVVEKPASVVKELVENSIDAGAKAITVEIKGGGIDLIRITDDGCGISVDELPKAFLRHATSKIQSDADLFYLQTLGFRGEALASIAAVSKVEMITKTKDSLTGTRITIEGGIQGEFEEIGAPDGTTILVRNLFYNTPARKKFLKSATTEGSYIMELMQHMALSMPSLSFKFVMNNAVKFHTSGNGDLKEVIYRIYGRDATKALIPVNVNQDGILIEGYLGKPELSRANRAFENYFVNRRYVRSPFIAKGIEEGYKGFMMQHQFPFCVLHINVDTTALDVNVHPTKMQVRMSNQEQLVLCLSEHIKACLSGKEMIPEAKLSTEEEVKEQLPVPEPFEKERLRALKEQETLKNVEKEVFLCPDSVKKDVKQNQPEHFFKREIFFEKEESDFIQEAVTEKEESDFIHEAVTEKEKSDFAQEILTEKEESVFTQELIIEKPEQMSLFEQPLLTKEKRNEFRVLGQAFKTYWLIEYDEKLYFLDQHAAHEKVKYEEFIEKYKKHEMVSQNLAPSIVVTMSPTDALVYEQYKDVIRGFGFEIDSFGGAELMIRSVPMDLYGADAKEMLLAILEELATAHSADKIDFIENRIATQACKAAVKGNHAMSFEEVSALLDQLLTLENPYQCPHGRPTMFSMTKYEIEKKFKRIL